ncbi:caspase family protein [Alkalinema pantanalense CENA528]|uniref:caspase family protein n=1 Tax=Alkalinema pantanalense TaxID=1620705 RepID=UPI003D6F6EB5
MFFGLLHSLGCSAPRQSERPFALYNGDQIQSSILFPMKRRDFLWRSGQVLTGLGVGQTVLSQTLWPIPAAEAAPIGQNPQKLALLIGINQYPDASLKGCLTDLELQQKLLIHRLGFAPENILTLADSAATSDAIAATIREHLGQQATASTIVFVHFSGLGCIGKTGQPTLLTANKGEIPLAQLAQWLGALPTDKITTILDTSFQSSGEGVQGNVRLRSRPPLVTADFSDLDTAPDTAFSTLSQLPSFPGLLVTATTDRFPGATPSGQAVLQSATELDFASWSAGRLTYGLTQALWQAAPGTPFQTVWAMTRAAMQPQSPGLTGTKLKEQASAPGAFSLNSSGGIGIITTVNPETGIGEAWLGGLPATVLEQLMVRSLLLIQAEEGIVGQVQLLERTGLRAKVRFVESTTPEHLWAIAPGQALQESIRVLPRQSELTIALDQHLTKVERVDAVSALSNVPYLTAINAGEGAADCLLAKMDEQATQVALLPNTPMSELVVPVGYGLFTPTQAPIPHTQGDRGEAVKVAIKRLSPTLQTLLAKKILRSTENITASKLGLRATLDMVSPEVKALTQQMTGPIRAKTIVSLDSPTVPAGSHLQYHLQNLGSQMLYWLLVGWDSRRNSYLILPTLNSAFGEIVPGLTQPLMSSPANPEWIVRNTTGMAEAFLIASTTPFSRTQACVPTDPDNFLHPLDRPLEIVQAILQDLQAASPTAQSVSQPETIALDHQTWATLRFTYQVV